MLRVNTRRFGELEIEEEKVLYFPDGIYGFEGDKRWILKDLDPNLPSFHWLQSLDDGDVALVVVDPFIFRPQYFPQLPEQEIAKLKLNSIENAIFLSIVVIPEDIQNMTANLQAPLVINPDNRIGRQIITTSPEYERRHLVFAEMKKNRRSVVG